MRMLTHEVNIGGVRIGGNNRIAIQSMCNTKTSDVEATVEQILRLEEAGCEIIRVAVPDKEAAAAIPAINQGYIYRLLRIFILIISLHFFP